MKPLGLATAYFNPVGYKSKLENFLKFYKGLGEASKDLTIVEVAFCGRDFELPDLPNIIKLRSDTICWQREAMINHAFRKMADRYQNLCWLDCDIEFLNEGWMAWIHVVLSSSNYVQVFESSFIEEGDRSHAGAARRWIKTSEDHQYNTGYGWAMPSSVWKACPLIDFCIVGGADTVMFEAAINAKESFMRTLPTAMYSAAMWWGGEFSEATRCKVGFAPNKILVHPHGSHKDRQYGPRHNILRRHNFNPYKDITRDENGLIQWAAASPQLREDVLEYFKSRREDG